MVTQSLIYLKAKFYFKKEAIKKENELKEEDKMKGRLGNWNGRGNKNVRQN